MVMQANSTCNRIGPEPGAVVHDGGMLEPGAHLTFWAIQGRLGRLLFCLACMENRLVGLEALCRNYSLCLAFFVRGFRCRERVAALKRRKAAHSKRWRAAIGVGRGLQWVATASGVRCIPPLFISPVQQNRSGKGRGQGAGVLLPESEMRPGTR